MGTLPFRVATGSLGKGNWFASGTGGQGNVQLIALPPK